jgi:hypothetical protein
MKQQKARDDLAQYIMSVGSDGELLIVRPIYRTGVRLLSRCCILYIFFQQI